MQSDRHAHLPTNISHDVRAKMQTSNDAILDMMDEDTIKKSFKCPKVNFRKIGPIRAEPVKQAVA